MMPMTTRSSTRVKADGPDAEGARRAAAGALTQRRLGAGVMLVLIHVHRQTLTHGVQVGGARRSLGRLAGLAQGGEEDRDQQGDDADDDQELDEGESESPGRRALRSFAAGVME